MAENESKIKELTSKLAAMKKTLNAEIETLEYKMNELTKHNVYLVSMTYTLFFQFLVFYNYWIIFFQQEELEIEKKKCLQEIKLLEVERNNLKIKLAKPNLQDQQVLEKGKYVYHRY